MLQIGFTASLFTCFGERKASIILIILLFSVLIEIFCQNQKIPFQGKTEISVIYQQDSKDCEAVYVGETKRTLNIRTNEHISAVKSASQRSHTAEHCWKYNHDFDWNNKRELDFEKKWKTRIIKEAIYSEENKHRINGISFKLPAIWKLILQKNNHKTSTAKNTSLSNPSQDMSTMQTNQSAMTTEHFNPPADT